MRLRITLWALLFIATVGYLAITISRALHRSRPATAEAIAPSNPADEKLRRDIAAIQTRLSAEAQQRIARREAARQQRYAAEAARAARNAAIVRWAGGLMIAVFGFIGAAAPLSALWNRLIVTCPRPGALQLIETGLWRRKRIIPLTDDAAVGLTQCELRTWGAGYSTWIPGTRSWAWVMVLFPSGRASAARVEFWLSSLARPAGDASLPQAELAEFVEPLSTLIGVRARR